MLLLTKGLIKNLNGPELLQFFLDKKTPKGEAKEELQLFRGFSTVFGKDETDPDLYNWTFSSEDVDSYGDTIDQKGWLMDRYNKNPIILWAHDHRIPGIGYAQKTWANPNLGGAIRFNPKEVDPFADGIRARIDFGTIKTGSVGFMPFEWEMKEERVGSAMEITGIHFLIQELMEFSICNVPANPFAEMDPKAAQPKDEPKPKSGFDFLRKE